MESELHSEATTLWIQGNIDACLQTLQKLESAHGLKDPKASLRGLVTDANLLWPDLGSVALSSCGGYVS